MGNPVDTGDSVVEQGGALGRRVALGQPFARIVHDIVGVRDLVDRDMAFEHAAVGAELLDTILHQGGQRCGQLFRADGFGAYMPVEAKPALSDPTELDDDIGTGRMRIYGDLHILAPSGVVPLEQGSQHAQCGMHRRARFAYADAHGHRWALWCTNA